MEMRGGVMYTESTTEIIDMGIRCLIEKLGIIDAEQFISTIIREKSDYTKWHQKFFSDVSSDDFHNVAFEYGKTNPL